MKYHITYACGHEETVSLTGKQNSQEYADWLAAGLCKECYKADKAKKEAEKAVTEDTVLAELGMKELEGSASQIEWAAKIRREKIMAMLRYFEKNEAAGKDQPKDVLKKYYAAKQNLFVWLREQTAASFWIDRRDKHYQEIINEFAIEKMSTGGETPADDNGAAAPKEEKQESQVVEPEEKLEDNIVIKDGSTKTNVCKIEIDGEEVSVKSDKDEDVIKICRDHQFKWRNQAWRMTVTEQFGTVEDRVAEIGNELLNAGYPVWIKDDRLKCKAMAGDYKPVNPFWIDDYADDFVIIGIKWGEDNLYNKAKKLPGAKWVSGRGMKIPARYYAEIRDFAVNLGYDITKAAQAKLAAAEEAFDNTSRVSVAAVKEKLEQKDGLAETLKTDAAVLEDLKDD